MRLAEFDATRMRKFPPRADVTKADLATGIRAKLEAEYVKQAQAVVNDLHGDTPGKPPPFRLTAQWKRKEIKQQADRMARSMTETLANAQARLAAQYPGNAKRQAVELRPLLLRQQEQTAAMIAATAQQQALVDQLVHTGAFDPAKDRIMELVGPRDNLTCGTCSAIMSGNPWTIEQSTNYGAKIHPNCRHAWETKWELSSAEAGPLRRKVRDGTLATWSGGGTTPGALTVKQGQAATAQTQGWPVSPPYLHQQLKRAGVPEGQAAQVLPVGMRTLKQQKAVDKATGRRS